jgi:hypothetical protein
MNGCREYGSHRCITPGSMYKLSANLSCINTKPIDKI